MPPFLLLAAGLLTVSPDAPASRADYEAARDRAAPEAPAQVALALWCEAHGLPAERLRHLALAALRDPDNAAARGLMGVVRFGDGWASPAKVARQVGSDDDYRAKIAEYHKRRDLTTPTADAQARLAEWCAANGLGDESRAHHAAVLKLDPGRDASWRALGYKKDGRRWVTPEQLAAEKEDARVQKEADHQWKASLAEWRGWLDQGASRRQQAEDRLAEVVDPRAVPSILSVFARGKPADRERAVRLLGQIDAAGSSRALAVLAAFDEMPEVRRAATETLRRRDPREFADLLIRAMLRPIRFSVVPGATPGAVGSIVIEGDKANLRRDYSLPDAFQLHPGDRMTYDRDGLPVLVRPMRREVVSTGRITAEEWQQILDPTQNTGSARDRYMAALQYDPLAMAGAKTMADFVPPQANLTPLYQGMAEIARSEHKSFGQIGFSFNGTIDESARIDLGRMQIAARARLNADVSALDARNASVDRNNAPIVSILSAVSGLDYGNDPERWQSWQVDQLGYSTAAQISASRPTLTQNAVDFSGYVSLTTTNLSGSFTRLSCFGAGTLVRTLDGSRPIENLAVGDRVLTQSVADGSLAYHPITTVHHNPPSPTFLVKVGADTIVSSPFHRFWVAGRGWVMARDLEGGETLRTLEGTRSVEQVEAGPVQPVFNLDVAGDHDFFAGDVAALVHDNSLPDTRLVPFDLAPTIGAKGK